MTQSAVIIGASGLIGSHLLDQMLNDHAFITVKILVRKELEIKHHKLRQVVVNFNNINDYTNKLGTGESIFCCIGTTQKKVKGDKDAYEKIDHDIPVNAAKIEVANGFKKFLIVSSVGANASSSNFYLQLKGRTEGDIMKFPFESISIFRPSMLLGKRKEWRPGERIGQVVMQSLSFAFAGGFKKYKPIEAEDVARAMIAQSKLNEKGVSLLEYMEIKELINKGPHRV